MASAKELSQFFKLLSVESRLRLIELLKLRSMCVSSLAKALGITDAAVSQHLRVLRGAELVTAEKRGYFVHYSLNEDRLYELWGEAVALLKGERGEPCEGCCPEGWKETQVEEGGEACLMTGISARSRRT